MDDARVVDRGQSLRHLSADVPAQLLRDPLELLEEIAEGLALDVLHDEEVLTRSIEQRCIAVEAPNHVLVLDILPDLGLAQEPLEETLRLEQMRVDDLERDGSAGFHAGDGLGGRGAVDLAHAARAELGDDLVGSESTRRSRLRLPFAPVLRPRLHDLAVQPHVLQHRLAVLLGGVLDAVVEEALGFGEVLVLAGGLPEVVAGLGGVARLACFLQSAASAAAASPSGRLARRARAWASSCLRFCLAEQADGLVESVAGLVGVAGLPVDLGQLDQ